MKMKKPFHPAFDFVRGTDTAMFTRDGDIVLLSDRLKLAESPKGYPSSKEAFHVYCHELAAVQMQIAKDPYLMNRYPALSQVVWAAASILELDEMLFATKAEIATPVLCVAPELAKALSESSLPPDVSDIPFPYSHGIILIHRDGLPGYESYPRWMAFHVADGVERKQHLVGRTWLYSMDCKGVSIVVPSHDGGDLVSNFAWEVKGDRADMVDGEIYYGGSISDEEEEYLSKMRRLLVNLFAYLYSRVPDGEILVLPPAPLPPTKGFGKPKSAESLRRPKIVDFTEEEDRQFKIVRRSDGTRKRKSPRPHQRIWHWRRVPVGKGRSGRKLTFIKETEVNKQTVDK